MGTSEESDKEQFVVKESDEEQFVASGLDDILLTTKKLDYQLVFYYCCKYGRLDIIIKILDLINIHDGNEHGFKWSCKYGQLKISKWLLNYGADVFGDILNESFYLSCIHGHINTAYWLYTLGVDLKCIGEEAFIGSMINGYDEITCWLSELCLFENQKNKN